MDGDRRRYLQLVEAQYGGRDLADSILRRARRGRREGAPLLPADLYAFDQVHTGGAEATRDLAALAGVGTGQRVLDVGCGLGGTPRLLAAELGCRAVGLDLTAAYCAAARRLTAAVGLEGRVAFQRGDATALPYAGARFDAVLLQHCTMNVPDKAGLFRECARVLRPGGTLALHEWVKLGEAPLVLPVRWAETPALDFIAPRETFLRLLGEAGFVEVMGRDASAEGRRWMEAQAGRAESQRAGLLFGNMARNLAEGRAACLMAAYRKA